MGNNGGRGEGVVEIRKVILELKHFHLISEGLNPQKIIKERPRNKIIESGEDRVGQPISK